MAVRPAVLALLLMIALPSFAAVSVTNLAEPVSIAGTWRVQAGDQPDWANPDFDDSAWSLTEVPADSPEGLKGYSGMLWFRLNVQLDLNSASVSKQLGALGVTLGEVTSAYEVYAGGTKIGGVGRLPPRPVANYNAIKTWSIPASAVSASGELVLALRVWRDPAIGERGEAGPQTGPLLIGNSGQLHELRINEAFWPYLMLTAIYLVFGLYHLLIARRNPGLTEFFWFGMLSTALGIYTFETSQLKYFIDLPFHWHKKLEYLVLFLAPFFLSKTLLGATRTADNPVTHGFNFIFVASFAAVLLLPYQSVLHYMLTPFQYCALALSIYIAGLMTWRAMQGSRSARGVIVVLLLVIAALINDEILAEPLIGSGNLLYLSFAVMLVFIALMMAERYTAILHGLESAVSRRTKELRQANRELAQAAEIKSQFLTTVSHEMRTPMNAILGMAHLSLKTNLDEQQRDYLTKLDQSAGDLQEIIDSILDFSKLQDGELECVALPFSPAFLAKELDRIWRGSIEAAGLEFILDVDSALPPTLSGDSKRIKQVLGNFIGNAIKFTEQGSVTLSIVISAQTESDVRLRFTVTDTGIGIDPSLHRKLFEAFAQADSSLTRQYGGTGLGLPIAQHLVELMGGAVKVDSQPGQGSTFGFELQLAISDEEAQTQETDSDIDLTSIRGAKVLLVDDSDLNLQVAGELLKQANLYVDLARDGAEAVEKVLSQSYDCVLMDVQMPVMDGYTATRQIRSREEHADLPILAMTANALPQDRVLGAEAGMNAYIPKPIDPPELYRALLTWIEPGQREFDESPIATSAENIEVSQNLPDRLPGINIADGLVRVGGNTSLYLSLLKSLCEDYGDATQRIEALLTNSDLDAAGQLAHKLRGIANNLGAFNLGESAAAIEANLKSGTEVDSEALSQLRDAVEITADSQRQLAPFYSAPEDASELDMNSRCELFQELLQAVADNDPAAGDLAEQLVATTASDNDDYNTLSAVRDALQMYDFPTAVDLLANLTIDASG
ncbi:MAG: ATP-binding protein [Halioglobus sp.]